MNDLIDTEGVLTIPRRLIRLTGGDLEAALLLSQIVYWSGRSREPGGWFSKPYHEWEAEIGLSQYRVSRAAGKLRELGLIETKIKRVNDAPTVHYRLV